MHTKPLSFWSTYPAFVLGVTAGLIALVTLRVGYYQIRHCELSIFRR